ncbi:intradiol ring-cleavage dioxygenase [Sabulilitoribacter multivorans]|uniref:Intradiol ring-cleavage dioxygenase n=1 Tax=Flaviramulus multivorans TaxID=1304750 RepID=A0ABS9IJF0_9FLAO|nr:intradiol ring-cleavage dioxygenase [Flaviramulus multivorans]MCF7560724.1 intradiol ring-cleavage dioxygenase [Flaviramulus multivorans]
MYKLYFTLFAFAIFSSCIESQNKIVGGPCEGCEAVYEYGDKILKHVDTITGFNTLGNKIKVSGVVYQLDGKTPAKNVILYIYHTDNKGKYPTNANSNGWERRHGYLRTWLKTSENGTYAFYTTRPASYPNSNVPQHIHITVKEPDKTEYYVEDFYFNDDPYLTKNIKVRARPRGGSGVIALKRTGELKEAKRNIILGLNIPNY